MDTTQSLLQQIRVHSVTWESMDDLEPLIHSIGDDGIVLLGEASHGTSEFLQNTGGIDKTAHSREAVQLHRC